VNLEDVDARRELILHQVKMIRRGLWWSTVPQIVAALRKVLDRD
jgi:hypothetical protein